MINFEYRSRYGPEDLVRLIALLRGPGGCPWDREQTHRSNRRNFLEEAYEAAEAFDRDDPVLMCEELGDMLMQVLFNIRMEEEAGRFTLEDVTDGVCKKLIYRHPHVFGSVSAGTTEEVLVNWEALKREEKGLRSASDNLDHVARSLPALWRAEKMQSKAAAAGFDWPDAGAAMDKLEEETGELRRALEGQGDAAEELGDLLFAAVKVGRFASVDPEAALHDACEKFLRRFRLVEEAVAQGGQALSGLPLAELERLWAEAKRREGENG